MRACLLLFLSACPTRIIYEYPCSNGGACPDGFSCRFDECVADGKVTEFDTCSDSRQCVGGLFCPPGLPLCVRPCTRIYAPGECGPSAVCVPVADRDVPGHFTGGACLPTECHDDDFCKQNDGLLSTANPANGCIRLASEGGLCLLRCQVGVRKASASSGVDLCISDRRANPLHCGRVASGDLICVPAGEALVGQACALYNEGDKPACSLNVVDNVPGLPLVCIDDNASVGDGATCHLAACQNDGDCQGHGTCQTANGLSFCR